jgi:histidyl-tRNA synthetase
MNGLPGFRDFYPDDCARRARIFATWRETALRYGFREVDGPPLEPLELYTRKSGEEIVGQLYHFQDKGERDVALRPEFTPTFARLVGARHRDFKKPVKWFAVPQLFRYERPQKGRLREHFQFNADLVGAGDAAEDAELIALLIDTLAAFGLGPSDVGLRISSRVLWHDVLRAWGVDGERHGAVFEVIDKVERMKPDDFARRMDEASGITGLDARVREAAAVTDLAELESQFGVSGEGVDRLREVFGILAGLGLGAYARLDLRIVRGLAYYTGVVFEAFAKDESGAYTGRAVAGGGRYDQLLKALAGVDLPAVGFGMGDVVLGELLVEKGLAADPAPRHRVYVVRPDAARAADGLALVRELRAAGFSVDYALRPGGHIGRQFQAAEECGARHAVIADDALARGEVAVKELATREQSMVPRARLVAHLGGS